MRRSLIRFIFSLFFFLFSSEGIAQTSFNVSNTTNGDTLLTIDGSGKVGIGITEPQVNLDIRSSDPDVAAGLNVGTSDDSHYLFFSSGRLNVPYPTIVWQEGDPLRFRTFGTSYTEHMRIGSTGNLGLGLYMPEARLDIQMAGDGDWQRGIRLLNPDLVAGNQLMLTIGRSDDVNNAGNVYFTYDDDGSTHNRLSFGLYAVNDVLNILSNGYVGIGTTEPTELLQVNGTVYSTSGGFRFPDGSLQSTAASVTGNTLDQAYDAGGAGAGRIIVADAGPVEITDAGGLVVNGGINVDNSIIIFGSGVEGGQLSLFDGDQAGGWQMDNFGNPDEESLRFFRDGEDNPLYNVLTLNHEGNVGIGTGMPREKLEVADTIYSSVGGFKFPDGSVQETAATTGESVWEGDPDISYTAGNVGIGTTTPLTRLHVEQLDLSLNAAALYNELVTLESGDAGLGLYSNNGGSYGSVFSMGEIVSGALTNKWSIFRTTSGANPANQLRFSYGSNPGYHLNPTMLALSENGYVGIGTTAPEALLEVAFTGTNGIHLDGNDDGDARISIENGGGSHSIYDDDDSYHTLKIESAASRPMAFNTNGATERMRINASGNVGIGTNSPSQRLDVNGIIYSTSGGFRFPDGSIQTTAADPIPNTLDQAYDQGGAGAGRTINADAGAFHVGGVDGAVFTGTWDQGTIPATGTGVRTMWYPRKAAFRTGVADDTQWDDASTGYGSFAAGRNTISSGYYATALGLGTTASGYAATAMGQNTTASGNYSTAMGYATVASRSYSMAMGRNIQAAGSNTIAIGLSDQSGLQVTQDNTLAIMGGKVGIEEIAPTADLHVSGTDGVLFTGAFGSGSIPAEGAGTRMMWYPRKAAFRVGRTTGYYWDDDNIGDYSVAMGLNSMASGLYSVAMGNRAEASGQSSLAIGQNATASGANSIALGSYSSASGTGSFAISDGISTFGNSVNNRFAARFTGGFYLYTDAFESVGAYLGANQNSWSSLSDSTKKENFKAVNGEVILTKIEMLKLGSWNYKNQDPSQFRHYGPMAQEFFSAFGHDGIGTIGCDTLLSSSDVDGINMIAIKALAKRTSELKTENEKLRPEIEQLKSRVEEIESFLERNENRVLHRAEFGRKTDLIDAE